MTTAGKPIRTGWCSTTAAEWSHRRCPGEVAGHPCKCECHQGPTATDRAAAAMEPLRHQGFPLGRVYSLDLEPLRLLLIAAACPVVCNRSGDWHQLCIEKADKALAALEVQDI